ncbi:MAG: hypothetical protein E7618_03220 [Ruminococcaceae bacterium]|nr:hypothetical protein [Oscillospiraceae bacterium]
MNKTLSVLKGKTEITLPLLQRDLSLRYREAKNVLANWIALGLVDGEVRGLAYTLNTRSISPRELGEATCERVVETISSAEMETLESLENAVGGREKTVLSDMDRLLSMGLVHEFVGRYFLSISERSMERLRTCRYTPMEIVTDNTRYIIGLIAHPILLSCLDSGEDCPELLASDYLPAVCKTYIEEGLKRYRNCAKRPSLEVNESEVANVGRYEIIEAFAGSCYYETKSEYCEAAEKNLSTIRSSPHCSTLFKRIASNATRSIVRELSLEDLQEIFRFLATKNEEDDD